MGQHTSKQTPTPSTLSLPSSDPHVPPDPAAASSTPSSPSPTSPSRVAHAAYDIDEWYPLLSPCTFPTFFLPLSPPTALALIHSYQTHCLSRPSLLPSDPPLLLRLTATLQSTFDLHPPLTQHGAFVRCSTRSPKDADIPPSLLHSIYHRELLLLETQAQAEAPLSASPAEAAANRRFVAYTRAQLACLRCHDGEQCLRLLSTSERVYTDLMEALGGVGVQVVVRGWEERLDPAWEFRCFVHRRRLTAISQYAYHCTFAPLQRPAVVVAVKAAITAYWQAEVHPRLREAESYESYVMDVAVVRGEGGEGDVGGCVLIELNPFTVATSACLFQWAVDGAVLRGERGGAEGVRKGEVGEVEVRVRTEVPRGMVDFVDAVLQEAGLDDASAEVGTADAG